MCHQLLIDPGANPFNVDSIVPYFFSPAPLWEVDQERPASKFDAVYYRRLMEKAWAEIAFAFKQTTLETSHGPSLELVLVKLLLIDAESLSCSCIEGRALSLPNMLQNCSHLNLEREISIRLIFWKMCAIRIHLYKKPSCPKGHHKYENLDLSIFSGSMFSQLCDRQ